VGDNKTQSAPRPPYMKVSTRTYLEMRFLLSASSTPPGAWLDGAVQPGTYVLTSRYPCAGTFPSTIGVNVLQTGAGLMP